MTKRNSKSIVRKLVRQFMKFVQLSIGLATTSKKSSHQIPVWSHCWVDYSVAKLEEISVSSTDPCTEAVSVGWIPSFDQVLTDDWAKCTFSALWIKENHLNVFFETKYHSSGCFGPENRWVRRFGQFPGSRQPDRVHNQSYTYLLPSKSFFHF